MTVSAPFLTADLPNRTQRVLLVALAFFLPPLPIYILTGPHHTFATKEFLISVLLFLVFPPGSLVYTILFITQILPTARRHNDGLYAATETGPVSGPCCAVEESGEAPKKLAVDAGESEPLLPTYDEAQGSSKGAQAPPVPYGDHKVQH